MAAISRLITMRGHPAAESTPGAANVRRMCPFDSYALCRRNVVSVAAGARMGRNFPANGGARSLTSWASLLHASASQSQQGPTWPLADLYEYVAACSSRGSGPTDHSRRLHPAAAQRSAAWRKPKRRKRQGARVCAGRRSNRRRHLRTANA